MAKINLHTATKYQGDMPVRYLNHCAKGGSTPEFLRDVSICRDTFLTWCETYPAMADAKKKGKALAEGWWIEKAREHLVIHNNPDEGTIKFDTSLYKFIMSGRFGHTSDRATQKMLETAMAQQALIIEQNKKILSSAYADTAEYTLIDDNTKTK